MSSTPIRSSATNESALDDRGAAERVHDAPRSASPDTPPYSPITPVMSSASLPGFNRAQDAPPVHQSPPKPEPPQQEPRRHHHRHHHHQQQQQQQEKQQDQQQKPSQARPLLPFSESDNPDAIALRSALSILQIQRQQALHDLKTLERQKQIAAADPEAFAAALMAGRVKTARKGGDGFGISPRPDDLFTTLVADAAAHENRTEDADERERPASSPPASQFEDMPGPQDVIRAPPINWAKYHIIGEPLDRLHEEQKARPTSSGRPRRGVGEVQAAPKHVIAAPYSPWTDTLLSENQIRTRGVARKDQ